MLSLEKMFLFKKWILNYILHFVVEVLNPGERGGHGLQRGLPERRDRAHREILLTQHLVIQNTDRGDPCRSFFSETIRWLSTKTKLPFLSMIIWNSSLVETRQIASIVPAKLIEINNLSTSECLQLCIISEHLNQGLEFLKKMLHYSGVVCAAHIRFEANISEYEANINLLRSE